VKRLNLKIEYYNLNGKIDLLEFFIEKIKERSFSTLYGKFRKLFKTKQEIRYFIDYGELFHIESHIFNRFLIKAQSISADLRINPLTRQGHNLVEFLSLIFKISSSRCLYSAFRIFWSSDFKYFRSIQIIPKGIVVDLESSSFDIIIVYDTNLPDILYASIVNNVKSVLANKKINFQQKESLTRQKNGSLFTCTSEESNFAHNYSQKENIFECVSISAISIMIIFVFALILYMVSSL
jgi:hypothetical protein